MVSNQKRNSDKAGGIARVPPRAVQRSAAQALVWRRKYRRGGTLIGVARARDLAHGRALSPRTQARMRAYFARHAVDLIAPGAHPGEPGYPSAGRIAWNLWGGDAAFRWLSRIGHNSRSLV